MVLREMDILPTQNERIFEALLFLDSDSCQSKHPKEIFFLNMLLRNEDILLPKIEQAFEGVSL